MSNKGGVSEHEKWVKMVVLSLALVGLMAMPSFATETIKAVVIDGYPARALWVREFTKFFIPEIDKRLARTGNYRMNWQESYGGTIVKPKGVLEGVKLGLGDIWHCDNDFPLIQIAQPGNCRSYSVCCSRCARRGKSRR